MKTLRRMLLLTAIGFTGWLIVEFFFNPHWTPECNVEILEPIVADIEYGISNVLAYGSIEDYQDYIDVSILDAYTNTYKDCEKCLRFPKVLGVNIKNTHIARCKPNQIIYWARVEIAQIIVDKETEQVEITCHGLANEGWYSITKRDDIWRRSDVEFWRTILYPQSPIDTATPVEVLRQNVCPP